jgi:pyruvate formate lyase activating enzyme
MANKISDAVVISGGEPTLQPEGLKKFIGEIKRRSKKLVKLDTNGTNPTLLKELLKDGHVDFVAMDIKGHFESYGKFNFEGGPEVLYESVDAILKSGINHQFRCTVGEDFEKKDLAFIKKNFPDIKLQKYRERK